MSTDISVSRHVIIDALRLARERVTGDSLHAKIKRRHLIDSGISRMAHDPGTDGAMTAGELRDLLGDLDDKNLRHALGEWDAA